MDNENKPTVVDSGELHLLPPQAKTCSHEQDCDCLIEAQTPIQELETKWEFKPRQNPKWGTVEKEGLIVGRGKNRKVVPPDEVYKLAALGCSMEEMCEWFQINRETLKYNFSEYITKGQAELKQRLRRAQIKTALDGNATLLIWLGKNILGQSDNPINSEENAPLPWSEKDI
jgi:hypothetical protein